MIKFLPISCFFGGFDTLLSHDYRLVPVHFPFPQLLRVFMNLFKNRSKDGNEEVEQHDIGYNEVDCQQDWSYIVVHGHVLTHSLCIANGIIA